MATDMRIHIKTICPEIVGDFQSGWYEINDGVSPVEALKSALIDSKSKIIDDEVLSKLVYMKNGKHISPNHILSDGDMLMALRPVYGG